MDKKEVAAISLKHAFNKKWWDKNRSFMARGSGTGEALADWQKYCPEDVATLKDPADVAKAETTCEALRQTLRVANKKCSKSDEDMLAAIKKMQKLIDEYEESLLKLKKAQTNKYVELNEKLHEIIELARTYRQQLRPLVNTVDAIKEQVERLEEQAENVEQLDESGKERLLRELGAEQRKLKVADEAMGNMAKALKTAESKQRNAIFEASKDAKFRPTLEKFRSGTADFDRELAEVFDLATELAGRLVRTKTLIEKGESIDSVIEELNKMVIVMQSAIVGHFRETVQVIKERWPRVVEFDKDPKSLTPRNWQDLALWEDDIKGAMDLAPTTSRKLEGLLRDIKRYNGKYGRNPLAKPLLSEALGLYQAAIKDRDNMNRYAPAYRKQLQTLLEQNHS